MSPEPADDDAPVLALFGRYRKTVTALIVGGLGWSATVITSAPAPISASEWLGLATTVAVAVGVAVTPNRVTPS